MTYRETCMRLESLRDQLRAMSQRQSWTPDDQRQWDQLNGEFDTLLDRKQSLERQADALRVSQADIAARVGGPGGGVRGEGGADDGRGPVRSDLVPTAIPADVATVTRDQAFTDHPVVRSELAAEESRYGELHFGRFMRGLATGEWAGAEAEMRAMSEGVLGAGGYTVPTILSSRLIELARKRARVMQAGATTVPMTTQTVNIARMTGDPSAAFRAENSQITASDASFDQITLKAKTLAALTVCSRELLEDSVNAEDALETAFAEQAALVVDLAALRGSGVDPEPRGVRNTTGVTIESMGTNGAALTSWDRIIDTSFALPDNNLEPNALIYSPRTARTLAKLVDSTGQPMAMPPVLNNLQHYVTNQIPNDLTQGTSTNASELFVGGWPELLIGLRTRFSVRVLTERYAEFGQVAFLSWWRGDVAVARPKAFAVLTGIIP